MLFVAEGTQARRAIILASFARMLNRASGALPYRTSTFAQSLNNLADGSGADRMPTFADGKP
jgi:hypothetical protein